MSHPLHLLLQVANRTLTQTWSQSVYLSEPQLIKQSKSTLIFRCRLNHGPDGIPSVVLKYIRSKPERGFCEWASLEFLSQLPTPHGAAPRFYAGDPQGAFFIMADLGPALTLVDLLQGSDPERPAGALHQMGTTMARLQIATQGYEDQLQKFRHRLPLPPLPNCQQEAEVWRFTNQKEIWNWLYVTGCPVPTGLETSIQCIAHAYANPGPFLSWTAGDPSPTNHIFHDHQLTLLDFEFSGFRHGLCDLAGWPMIYPLPDPWIQALITGFRSYFPGPNDQEFDQAMAYLSAYWGCNIIGWISPHILQADAPWPTGYWQMRPALLAAITRLGKISAPWPELAPLSEAALSLEKALRQIWPEWADIPNPMPPWPVLKTLGENPHL